MFRMMDASMEKINASMIRHARQVAEEIKANAVLVYVDVVQSKENREFELFSSNSNAFDHSYLNIQEVDIMTLSQAMIMAVWFMASCAALVWLLLDARKNKTESPPNRIKDREQVIEMLATVGDQFSFSIYKKAYKIDENDISPP